MNELKCFITSTCIILKISLMEDEGAAPWWGI